jgi:hypothetical protein
MLRLILNGVAFIIVQIITVASFFFNTGIVQITVVGGMVISTR